jgi:cytochrome c553
MRISWIVLCALPAAAQQQAEFFEKKIRPVLATRCYACHSAKLKSPMGGLTLDTREGTHRAVEGKLLSALRYANPNLQMPPGGKLPDGVIADFEQWIADGAPDPRQDSPAAVAKPAGIDFAKGRTWWAFQPVHEFNAPNTGWARRKADGFILGELEKNNISPSPEADRRTLIRRAALDLTGIAPGFEEIEAFAANDAPDAYERLVERLLASQRYGERWGRYWLDVTRWGEDNPTTEATNPGYQFAWRYRDWVIEALNYDLPYDRFVKMQLAADLLPGFQRDDLRALGFLGAAPTYHKDLRLSRDVIETLASDDWDERVDAVSRGLLGLTVACARCHDHKFDPISNEDYYSMAGVFASSMPVRRPLSEVDAETEQKVAYGQVRGFFLEYLIKLVKGESGTVRDPEQKVARFQAELAELKKVTPEVKGDYAHAVIDAGLWVDGSETDLTKLDYRMGQPRDLPIFLRGNPANTGAVAPRHFITVLEKGKAEPFRVGSGRLELAEKMFSGASAPLAGRVIVNRVWGWHFGKPLVGTPSDFGTQGDAPTHRELLDDLTARFISSGWSIKWLHREIMLSAAYRQSSHPREEGKQKDPTNRLLWRMNPRRLDFEAWRDTLLETAGVLDPRMGGAAMELEAAGNRRRTAYARVSRARLSPLLKLYDFPDPNQHAPNRELTTTPLQQLFVMNSGFAQEQARLMADRAVAESGDVRERVQFLYRSILRREADGAEIDLALSYLDKGDWAGYAQALLGSSEFIFWP